VRLVHFRRLCHRPPPLMVSGAPGSFASRLQRMARATEEPEVRPVQRCSAVLELDNVINEHPALRSTASWCLTSSPSFSSNTIAHFEPRRRQVEGVRSLWRWLCNMQGRHRDAGLECAHDRGHQTGALSRSAASPCLPRRCLTHSYCALQRSLDASRVRSTRYRHDHVDGECWWFSIRARTDSTYSTRRLAVAREMPKCRQISFQGLLSTRIQSNSASSTTTTRAARPQAMSDMAADLCLSLAVQAPRPLW
jgi:hypothetical protein